MSSIRSRYGVFLFYVTRLLTYLRFLAVDLVSVNTRPPTVSDTLPRPPPRPPSLHVLKTASPQCCFMMMQRHVHGHRSIQY